MTPSFKPDTNNSKIAFMWNLFSQTSHFNLDAAILRPTFLRTVIQRSA